jgi:hypothetical protein
LSLQLSIFDYSNINQDIVKDITTVFSQSGKSHRKKTKGLDVVCLPFPLCVFCGCFWVMLRRQKFCAILKKAKSRAKNERLKRATI